MRMPNFWGTTENINFRPNIFGRILGRNTIRWNPETKHTEPVTSVVEGKTKRLLFPIVFASCVLECCWRCNASSVLSPLKELPQESNRASNSKSRVYRAQGISWANRTVCFVLKFAFPLFYPSHLWNKVVNCTRVYRVDRVKIHNRVEFFDPGLTRVRTQLYIQGLHKSNWMHFTPWDMPSRKTPIRRL